MAIMILNSRGLFFSKRFYTHNWRKVVLGDSGRLLQPVAQFGSTGKDQVTFWGLQMRLYTMDDQAFLLASPNDDEWLLFFLFARWPSCSVVWRFDYDRFSFQCYSYRCHTLLFFREKHFQYGLRIRVCAREINSTVLFKKESSVGHDIHVFDRLRLATTDRPRLARTCGNALFCASEHQQH